MRITPSQVLFSEALYAQHPLKTLSVEPVSLEGRRGSFTQSAKILYGFKQPSDLPVSVTIEVTLGRLVASEDTMLTLSLNIVGRSPEYDYIVNPPSIILQSPDFSGFTDTDRAGVKAIVNVEGLLPGVHRITPQVNLPPSIGEIGVIPESIEVSVIQR